jgi:hypothetical protein
LGNVLEDRLRKIKVVLGRVAPTPCIVRESIVWWAEIGGCNDNGAWQAPFRVTHALNLIARPAAQTIVEQSSAQSRSVRPIPLAVQVPIPTSSTCTKNRQSKWRYFMCLNENLIKKEEKKCPSK